jgi:type II secretory pathway pseudopilin PulG
VPTRLARNEDGFELIELLIALTILSIGILAIVAGFSSGMVALANASHTSTAATIADKKMEEFRRVAFTSITPSTTTSNPTGPDGRQYWMSTSVAWNCPLDNSTPVAPPACPAVGTPPVQSRAVKIVTIVVRDGSSSARMLMSESSTFDEATG